MSAVQRLSSEGIQAFVNIVINAYPGFNVDSEESRQRLVERLVERQDNVPGVNIYGLYRDDKLLGGMQLFDFRMNMLGTEIGAGGVGLVAVDLLHKKEHVAKEMLAFYLEHYRQRGDNLAMLYPFRCDFYYAMGFGYGTKMSQYTFRPAALKGKSKSHVRYLTVEDKPGLVDCYDRYQARTHGMIVRSPAEWDARLKNLGLSNRIVGCELDGQLAGYIIFTFKARPVDNPMRNNLIIKELVYTDREALGELLTFLKTQADQVDRVELTTYDETFQYLLSDPRNECETLIPSVYHQSNVQGVGLMYRVLNVRGLFTELIDHNFNGQCCRLKLSVEDSFLPDNAGSTLLFFEDGRVTLAEEGAYDVELSLGIAEFSALILGAVTLKQLYAYGLAEISEVTYLETLNRLFAVEEKPVCLTAF